MKFSKEEQLRQFYGNGLYQVLLSEGISEERCLELVKEFGKLSGSQGKMSGAGAANIIYSAYGSLKSAVGHQKIKSYVETELENINKSHPGINTNYKTRFVNSVRTLNDKIQKCDVILDGKELDKEEILNQAKVKVPEILISSNGETKMKFTAII